MQIVDSVVSSFQTILAHKMRSFLTMLGMMIGVISVVTMFAMVDSFKTIIKKNMEGMGWNNSIIIQPEGSWSPKGRRRYRMNYMSRRSKPLTLDDVAAIKEELDAAIKEELDLKSIYGVIDRWVKELVNGEHRSFKVKSTTNDFFASKTYSLSQGRLFSHYEIKNREAVCVIGEGFVLALFQMD